MAVTLAGAPPVPGVMPGMRERVNVNAQGRLSPHDLDRVCRRVQYEHGRALVRRRFFLRQASTRALLWAGARPPSYRGVGPVRSGPRLGSPLNYAVLLTPRPAELGDFHYLDEALQACERGVVLGPRLALEPGRRASLAWLARRSRIVWKDEGRMLSTARGIAKGTL